MRFPAFINFKTLIMRLIILTGILFLLSCSKANKNDGPQERSLQITIKDYQPTSGGNHYWGVELAFNSVVTLSGSVNVEYDVYSAGILYKHYAYKIQFSLSNQTTYIYNSLQNSQISGAEIKNIKIEEFKTDGNYKISLKDPIGVAGASTASGGCGTHNGRQLYKGPDGGCYYINSSGNKTYVNRSECHC
jgi:hypothetical protein